MTETPKDWNQSAEAKYLVSVILARYHKTRMADTDVHSWIISDRLVQSALTALSTQSDYRAMLARTARYITHDRDCATIARHGGHLCSCGASAAARDARAAEVPD